MDPTSRLAITMTPAHPAVASRQTSTRKRERSPSTRTPWATSRLSLRHHDTTLPPQPTRPIGATSDTSPIMPSSSLKTTSSSLPTPLSLRNDRLGASVRRLARLLTDATSWREFVTTFRGRSYLSPNVGELDHPASKLLQQWMTEGVPIRTSNEPWSPELKDSRFRQGCHRSANDHAEFLRDELADFIDNGFWVVLPYDLVRDLPTLQLSPCSVKEERDRRPRLLCDHSWFTTNEDSLPNVPREAMQFGRTLDRVLRNVRHANPRYGPVYISKHDLKDGFYRLFVRPNDCPKLTIMLPRCEDETPLVAIPMALTMGWVQSPPSFCAMSETIADVANARFQMNPQSCPQHRLQDTAAALDQMGPKQLPIPRTSLDAEAEERLARCADARDSAPETCDVAPPSNTPWQRPLGTTDACVDDFIQLGQGGRKRMNAL